MAPDLQLAAFRYHPAIGGAERYARRLLQELGTAVTAEVLTLCCSNRTDWLQLLSDGERDSEQLYKVDGPP